MSERSVRVVYHTGNRTFAKLFNERSLDELRDVVRRKLGLGQETHVSLKQMGTDALLDLEDDDDFQAFRILLRSAVSVDIQVTVGRSQGPTVPPPVAPKLREQPSVSESTTTSSASPSKQLVPSAASRESSAHPEVARTTQTSATAAKTTPSARKRKVSFDDAALAAPGKSVERRASKKVTAVTPVAPAGTAESPATPKPIGAEEPPKKRQKKEATKAKDVQPTMAVQSSPAGASDALRPKPRKSAASDHQSESSSSPLRDVVTSELLIKRPTRRKEDDGAGSGESPASVDQGGMDQLTKEPDNPVNEASLQPAPKKPKRTSVRPPAWAFRPRTITDIACEAVPPTTECANVLSEVIAALLPDVANAVAQPERKTVVRKDTKKSSVLSNSPCPICLEEPFHIRYYCPTVLRGPDAIQERLEELKRTNMGDQQWLINELEGLLRVLKVASKPSLNATPTDGVQSREASPPPSASLLIPNNSYVSEVTVESRDEGSSSESSNDMSEGEVEPEEFPAPRRQQTPGEQPSTTNDDLEAVIRGPAPRRQSILHVIDRIVGDDDSENSDSEEDEAELEEDPDEEIDRSRRRSSRYIRRSSDSESEDEESMSPSPPRPAEGILNNPQPGVQGSNGPAEGSAKHQDDGVAMGDSVGPPVLERQNDDSSEETHVGSEDRTDMDHESIGEKRAATIVEQRSSFPAPRASEAHNEVETDPIEPSDDLEPPAISHSSDADPIEAPEGIGSLFTCAAQSTPKPGVTKRIKARNGQIQNDEAERPVLLEQLPSEATNEVTPLPTKEKSRRKITEMSANQEPAPTRRSPRFSSLPPSTSTPVAVALLNHRPKVGARIGKATKTPAKQSEERSGASQSNAGGNIAQNGARIAPTPSLIGWETLAEPSSPPVQLDETSVRIDELMSSSPQPEVIPKGRSRNPALSSQAERLFDLSSSQIPFPYSQHQNNSAPKALPNGKEREGVTESDSDSEPTVSKKKAKLPVRYRSLSHLASQATTLFSPSLLTPANKSVTNGMTKKRIADEDSSSSSSDADEANGSGHIPRGRRAGSVLETKKKKSRLSRI